MCKVSSSELTRNEQVGDVEAPGGQRGFEGPEGKRRHLGWPLNTRFAEAGNEEERSNPRRRRFVWLMIGPFLSQMRRNLDAYFQMWGKAWRGARSK